VHYGFGLERYAKATGIDIVAEPDRAEPILPKEEEEE
jgi:hypothetical protein